MVELFDNFVGRKINGKRIYPHNRSTGDEYYPPTRNVYAKTKLASGIELEIYAKKKNNDEFYRKENNSEVYAKRGETYYYAQYSNGDEYYATDRDENQFYIYNNGKIQFAKQKVNNKFIPIFARDKNGNLIHPPDDQFVYTTNEQGETQYFYESNRNSPQFLKEYYGKAGSKEIYRLGKDNEEKYAQDENRDEYYAKDAEDKEYYARNSKRKELYAKKRNNKQVYRRVNNVEYYARDEKGREYYATDEKGKQYCAHDGNTFYFAADENGVEYFPAGWNVNLHDEKLCYPSNRKTFKPIYPFDSAGDEYYRKKVLPNKATKEIYGCLLREDGISRGDDQVYAQDKDSNERAAKDEQDMFYYTRSGGREIYPKNSQQNEYFIMNNLKELYARDKNKQIYPHFVNLHEKCAKDGLVQYYAKDGDDEYYPRTYNGDEYCILDKDKNFVYAKSGGKEIYPELKNNVQYYIRRGEKEIYAEEKPKKQYYLKNNNLEYPALDRGKFYYATDENSMQTYPHDAQENEYYLKNDNVEFCASDKEGNIRFAMKRNRDEFYPKDYTGTNNVEKFEELEKTKHDFVKNFGVITSESDEEEEMLS